MSRNKLCRVALCLSLFGLLAGVMLSCADAQEEKQKTGNRSDTARLSYVALQQSDDLNAVTSVAISKDGRYLYAAAYQADALSVHSRDADTGKLEHVQTIRDNELLDGAVALRLSPDGKYAVATSFRANSVALLSRDAKSGKLELIHSVRDGDVGAALNFAIDAAWSPDSQFVYVIADSSAALNAFRITDGKLELVEVQQADGALLGARGITVDPKGRAIYVAASRTGILAVLSRDSETGKTKVLQIMQDGGEMTDSLGGAFSVATTENGRYIYVSTGRFGGDDSVVVFRRRGKGKLRLVQSLVNDTDRLRGFNGGNEITVAPDQSAVYAVASLSDTLTVFSRNTSSGELQQTQVISNASDGVRLATAGGIAVSPDSRFVYIASEADDGVAIFRVKGQDAEDEK